MNYKAIIEAILFTMGESVELEKISSAIDLDRKQTKKIIEELQKEYEDSDDIDNVSSNTSDSTLFLGCFAIFIRYSYILGFVHI